MSLGDILLDACLWFCLGGLLAIFALLAYEAFDRAWNARLAVASTWLKVRKQRRNRA